MKTVLGGICTILVVHRVRLVVRGDLKVLGNRYDRIGVVSRVSCLGDFGEFKRYRFCAA